MRKTILRQSAAALVIALVCVIYISCDDAGVIVQDEFCISGQITGWTLGSNKTFHAFIRNNSGSSFVIASCPIDAQGNFKLCPPAAPDSALYPSDSIFYSGCTAGTVTFNPPDVRGTETTSFRVKDSAGASIGTVTKKNYTGPVTAGSFSVLYVWVTKNVTVHGWKDCGSDSLFFDGSAETNWNKVVKNYTRVDTNGRTILYNTTEPSGAEWRYTSY